VAKLSFKYKSLPVKTKQILLLGLVLALVVALPLFIWAIMTQRFDIRKRAATGEPTCTRIAPTLTASSPRTKYGNPGDILFWTLDITNNDSYLCPATIFNFSIDKPSNWDTFLGTNSYQVGPQTLTAGQSTTIYGLNVTSPTENYIVGPQPITVRTSTLEGNIHTVSTTVTYNLVEGSLPTLPPSPTPIGIADECSVCGGGTDIRCVEGLFCDIHIVSEQPVPGQTGICVKPDGSSICASPTPVPTPLKIGVRVKFAGVDDGSAEGAKATLRFVSGALNYLTTPFEFTHWNNGLYYALVQPSFYPLLTPDGDGTGYTIYVKGEKHVANKYCIWSGQTGPCQGSGNITIPGPVETAEPTFFFYNYPLEPGDLPPQDGRVDQSDFLMLTELMGKLCSNLTDVEKVTADLDYNGCINVRDAFLLRKTLETRYDDF